MANADFDGEAGEDRFRIIEIDIGLVVERGDGRQRQLVGRERIVGSDGRRKEPLPDDAVALRRRRIQTRGEQAPRQAPTDGAQRARFLRKNML